MPNRRKDTMDVRAVLVLLRARHSEREVTRSVGVARETVKRRQWAESQGLLEGDQPPLEELQHLLDATMPGTHPPQNHSSVASYLSVVEKLIKGEVEIAAIWERLKERGFSGSYSSVYRFVRRAPLCDLQLFVVAERLPCKKILCRGH